MRAMFSRFTEKAIQAIMLAQEEAKRFHHSYVGTEHILLGIIGDNDNLVVKTLDEMGQPTEAIKASIEERLEYGGLNAEYGNIPFTQQAKQVLTHAWSDARKLGHNYVNVEHLFLSIFRDPTSIASRVLNELGVTVTSFSDVLYKKLGDKVTTMGKVQTSIPTPTLDLFGRELTWLAKEDKLDPVVGRSKEIERIIQILCRRTKNNPVLTGEPGVGKTAIVEGLAQKIIAENIPDKLKNKRVITLDLGLLVAGTKYRGEFEDRVKKVMEEARKAGNVIIFVDELHTIIGTGGSEGSLDAANLFKPALARGELQIIGATTLDEYRKHIEGDGALERRFQSILVEQPSTEEALMILHGIRKRYEEFHNVTITDDALEQAVDLSTRYISDRFLPDKAVDVIDEAAARVMLQESMELGDVKTLLEKQTKLRSEKDVFQGKKAQSKEDQSRIKQIADEIKEVQKSLNRVSKDQRNIANKIVDEDVVAVVISQWTGIPVIKLNREERKQLLKLEAEMKKRIVGQDNAILALIRAVKRSKIGLKDPNKPTGSFLFMGPTGVGKSELAKTLSEFLFGTREALIRIDMSEYSEKHTISKLIGSPPGYVGFNEGGQLTEQVRRKPYSVLLFDELEKASHDVINILLQILEDGRLTDSNGRSVDFKNTIIIMTSNVGSKYIQQETSFGFVDPARQKDTKYEAIKAKLDDALRQEFKPEFINRIDDIIVFKSLQKEDLFGIVDIMLGDLKFRLAHKDIHISYDKKVKDFLVDNGFDQKLGARPLRRSIQEHFEDQLADYLLEEGLYGIVHIKSTVRDKKVVFMITKRVNKKPKKKSIKPKLVSLA